MLRTGHRHACRFGRGPRAFRGAARVETGGDGTSSSEWITSRPSQLNSVGKPEPCPPCSMCSGSEGNIGRDPISSSVSGRVPSRSSELVIITGGPAVAKTSGTGGGTYTDDEVDDSEHSESLHRRQRGSRSVKQVVANARGIGRGPWRTECLAPTCYLHP
jgi:hypothetical protein